MHALRPNVACFHRLSIRAPQLPGCRVAPASPLCCISTNAGGHQHVLVMSRHPARRPARDTGRSVFAAGRPPRSRVPVRRLPWWRRGRHRQGSRARFCARLHGRARRTGADCDVRPLPQRRRAHAPVFAASTGRSSRRVRDQRARQAARGWRRARGDVCELPRCARNQARQRREIARLSDQCRGDVRHLPCESDTHERLHAG